MSLRRRQGEAGILLASFVAAFALIAFGTAASLQPKLSLNDRPIIGVLTQEISWHLDGKWPGVFKSYIAASYVKFVEGGGARVVPIW